MFDVSKAGVNIGQNFRAEEAVDGVSVRLQYGGLFCIMFRFPWQTMPIVAITEDNSVCIGKQKIHDGNIAKGNLGLIRPPSSDKCLLSRKFNIGCFVLLVRQLPNGFTGVRACVSGNLARMTPNLFAAYSASEMGHIMNPVLCFFALPLVVSAFTRAKANLAAGLICIELFAAVEASTGYLARPLPCLAKFLASRGRKFFPAVGVCYFGDMLRGFDAMLLAMNSAFRDLFCASRMGAGVFWTRHLINS